MPCLGHNGTDSKQKSPLTHPVSLGSVHPRVPESCIVVFQGKVMRALVVVGGQAGGAGKRTLPVSVCPLSTSFCQDFRDWCLWPFSQGKGDGDGGWPAIPMAASGPALSPSSRGSPSPPCAASLPPSFPSMSNRVLGSLTRLESIFLHLTRTSNCGEHSAMFWTGGALISPSSAMSKNGKDQVVQ